MAEEALAYVGTPASRSGTPLRTLLLPLAILVVVLSKLLPTPPGSTLPAWLLGLALALFVLALNSQAWVVAPLLIVEMSTASYVVPQLHWSLRLLVVMVGVALAAPILLRAGLSDPRLGRVLKPSIILVAVATLVDFMTSSTSYTTQYLRYQAELVIIMVLVALVVRTRRELLGLSVLALIVGVVSGAFSIMQHYSVRFPLVPVDPQGRAMGLGDSPVSLALQMLFVLVPLLGVLLAGHWRLDRLRLFLVLSAVVMAIAMYLSETRSALLGVAAGVIAMAFCFKGERRTAVFGLVGVAVVLFFALQGTGIIKSRYYTITDSSGNSHNALLDVSLQIVQTNPIFGIGHANFQSVGAQLSGGANIGLVSTSSGAALANPPHDDFLYVWLSWGIGALVAYVAIFIGALRNFLVAARHSDLLIRGLAVGGVGVLVAYGVQSAFHNALDGSSVLWICAGLSVALARVATASDPMPNRSRPVAAGRPIPVTTGDD